MSLNMRFKERISRFIVAVIMFTLVITTVCVYPMTANAEQKEPLAKVSAYPIVPYSLGSTVVYELDNILDNYADSGRYYKIVVDKKMDVQFYVAAEWDDTAAGLYDSNFDAIWNVMGNGTEGYTFTKPWDYDPSEDTFRCDYLKTTTLNKGTYYVGFANLDSEDFCESWIGLSTKIVKVYPAVTKPSKMSVKKISVGKKKMTVSWAAHKDKAVKGYEVRYKVKGTKKWTTKKIAGTKKSVVIKKLKKGKKYNVQIRAYKLDGKTKVYGDWSKTKTSKKIK